MLRNIHATLLHHSAIPYFRIFRHRVVFFVAAGNNIAMPPIGRIPIFPV
jgi:hypothetical protein